MCLPSLSLYYDVDGIGAISSSISVKETVGGSPGDVTEEPVTKEKRKKGWRMNCDVGEATEELENEL